MSNALDAMTGRPPPEGTGASASQVSVLDTPMLETEGAFFATSRSPQDLPAAS